MLRLNLSVLSIALLSFISFGVQAETTTTTVVERHVITTPEPKAVCTAVAGHWEGNVWVGTHNECNYENRTEGATWVNDYWSCTDASADGTCNAWALVPGHWATTTAQ